MLSENSENKIFIAVIFIKWCYLLINYIQIRIWGKIVMDIFWKLWKQHFHHGNCYRVDLTKKYKILHLCNLIINYKYEIEKNL